jgi:hypothetical protein
LPRFKSAALNCVLTMKHAKNSDGAENTALRAGAMFIV